MNEGKVIQMKRQLEFYFGDENWAKDKFLQSISDEEGWVNVNKILDFKNMKKITSGLSSTEIDQALFDSMNDSLIVELNGPRTLLRRLGNKDMNAKEAPKGKRGNDDATIHVGNLPSNVTEELLWELFMQAGPVVRVFLSGNFAFVEFANVRGIPYICQVFQGVQLVSFLSFLFAFFLMYFSFFPVFALVWLYFKNWLRIKSIKK